MHDGEEYVETHILNVWALWGHNLKIIKVVGGQINYKLKIIEVLGSQIIELQPMETVNKKGTGFLLNPSKFSSLINKFGLLKFDLTVTIIITLKKSHVCNC